MADDKTSLGLRLFKRADKLREKRSSVMDPQWQQISQYFWPDVSDINTEKTESTENWFDRIYDTAPVRAGQTCSVGVRNWVTPSTEPWLDLSPPYNLMKQAAKSQNPRLERISKPASDPVDDQGQDDATRWTADAGSQILNWLSESNFYSVVQTYNRSACTFGTGLMFMEEGKAATYNFEQFKIGTYVISENEEKVVDTVFRWFKLTVRQAEQRFGEEELPPKMKKALKSQKYDEEYKFIHCVYPNADMRKGSVGDEGMAFKSVYLAEDEKKIVMEGGYEEMPYFCLRWSRWGSENYVWGCSPGFEVLAEARQINYVTQYNDALVELKAFPRVFVPDSVDGNVEMASGAVTILKADDMARGVEPKEWLTGGDTQEIALMLERKEKAINSAFFVDIFKALGQLEDKITQSTYGAIALLQGEKLDQFTGTFDQYRTELINPLVRRAIGIAYRNGLLKDPPQSLMVKGNDPKAEPELASPKITIKSRVTLALSQAKIVGTEKTLQMLAPLMEQRPEIGDNFNWNQLSRNVGRGNGMAENDFLPLKTVLEKQEQRVKMQKQEMALKAAEIAAKSAGAMGKAPPQFQQKAGDMLDSAAQPAA